MFAIRVDRVSKRFYLHDRPRSFQELVLTALGARNSRTQPTAASANRELWALRDVSFEVCQGETLGIIGSNGSGKSTCLKLLTRIYRPTMGSISVQGRVSALLELGAGFHPELTGRENVYLYGSVLGLGRREMARRFDDIVAFAELSRFIDEPIKFYSSGMYVRLAFATAINVNPDILLIDEVLAVGDQHFQDKCLQRIRELKARGMTIVFVSHNLETVASLCDRVMWLHQGKLKEDGPVDQVIAHYLEHIYGDQIPVGRTIALASTPGAEPQPQNPPDVFDAPTGDDTSLTVEPAEIPLPVPDAQPAEMGAEGAGDPEDAPQKDTPEDPIMAMRGRWGTREAEITGVRFLDALGEQAATLLSHQPVTIEIGYFAHRRIEEPICGVAIHRADGCHICGSNTELASQSLPAIEGAGQVRYQVDALPLLEGDYYLSVAIHGPEGHETYDYQHLWYPFHVSRGSAPPHQGLIYMPATWTHIVTGIIAQATNMPNGEEGHDR